MRIFLAGIMQGSHTEDLLHCQNYRQHLKELLAGHFPTAEIYDPLADHGESLGYDDATGRRVFLNHNRMCQDVDLLVAFVPQASMGTAIEMWEAHRHGRTVISISPLAGNWAIKFLSHAVYRTLEDFAAALSAGEVARLLSDKRADNLG